ncbi:MAG TPA: ABC transporter substrate-binding protein [Acidiferrobacterales bacterium]|nr:ABC transporter substrate-binding protein [Acidiferrobacterales bacterium]
MIKIIARLFSPIVISLGLVLATSTAHAQGALEKPKITIAVGGKSLFYYLPLTIADQLGYFKAEGLTVEIVDFPGGAKALQAMVGGSADLVSGAYEHTINMQAKGIMIASVALQGRYSGMVLGLSKAKAATYKSAKDLQGMKIGVTAPGSSTNMFVNNLLTKEGLKPDAVAIIGVGATAGAVAAMRSGEIDAISNLDPVITQLESAGDIVVVADSRTAEGMQAIYGGAYGAGCIYAPLEFVKKNPNTTQAVANAIVRALRWIQKATPEQIVAAVPPEYYGADKAMYHAALVKNLPGYSPDGRMSMAGAQNVYKVLKAFEPSVMTAKVDLSKTFDNSFVERALKKYP